MKSNLPKMHTSKKHHSEPLHSTTSKAKPQEPDAETTEFQLRFQQFMGTGGAKNMESFAIGLTGDTAYYNPLKHHSNNHGSTTLLNFKPLKPKLPEGLSRKLSTDKMATAEIDFVSNIVRKANLPSNNPFPFPRTRNPAPKVAKGSVSAAKMSFTPLPEDEIKARAKAAATKIPKFNSPETFLSKLKGKSAVPTTPFKSTKSRISSFVNPYEKLQMQKHFLKNTIADLEKVPANKVDTVKAWVQNTAPDKRINASKILGNIISKQPTATGKVKTLPKIKIHRSSEPKPATKPEPKESVPLPVKKTGKESIPAAEVTPKVVSHSQAPVELPQQSLEISAEPELAKTEEEDTTLPPENLEPRPDTVIQFLNEPDEPSVTELEASNSKVIAKPGDLSLVHPPMSFHFNLNLHTIDGTAGFVNLSDLEKIEKKVDEEIQKYTQSVQQKSKRAPVFLITKQGTVVRGATGGVPVTVPKKVVQKTSIGHAGRKWSQVPTARLRYPIRNRLRKFQRSFLSKPKSIGKLKSAAKGDPNSHDIEQGDRYAEVRAQLAGTEFEAQTAGPYPQPPSLQRFHGLLRRIQTLESKFKEMNLEMSVLQKEKREFQEFLKFVESTASGQELDNLTLEGKERMKVDAEISNSTPSYKSSSYESSFSSTQSSVNSPRPNRSTGDMSVSTTGDQALTLQFLQAYDSFFSICNDTADDPTDWPKTGKNCKQNVGAYIEEVYQRSQANRRHAPLLQDHIEVEAEHSDQAEAELSDQDDEVLQAVLLASANDHRSQALDEIQPEIDLVGDPIDSFPIAENELEVLRPESEPESYFPAQSEGYNAESEGSEHWITGLQLLAPENMKPPEVDVERLYENEDFDYLYETQAPPLLEIQETPSSDRLKQRTISRNALESSLHLTLVNSQAFPFTNLERSVLEDLGKLPESPEVSDASGFLSTGGHDFVEKSSVAKLSVVSLPYQQNMSPVIEAETPETKSEEVERIHTN